MITVGRSKAQSDLRVPLFDPYRDSPELVARGAPRGLRDQAALALGREVPRHGRRENK